MKRITVTLTEEKCVEYTQLAQEQGHTLGSLCSFLLQSASITFRQVGISASLPQSASQGVEESAEDAEKGVDERSFDEHICPTIEQELAALRSSASQGVAIAPDPVPVPPFKGVEHLPEHDVQDADGWTPWERHLLSPGSPNYRTLAK